MKSLVFFVFFASFAAKKSKVLSQYFIAASIRHRESEKSSCFGAAVRYLYGICFLCAPQVSVWKIWGLSPMRLVADLARRVAGGGVSAKRAFGGAANR